jgi:diguanylate cyclase (GGDEF)-like protein
MTPTAIQVPTSLSDVRSALEDKLIVILGVAIPIIAILSSALALNIISTIVMIVFAVVAPSLIAVKKYLKPFHKYCIINILTICIAISLCIDLDTLYIGLLTFLMTVVFNVVLRGTRVGINYLVFCTLVIINFAVMHATGYIALKTPAKDLIFWCSIIAMTTTVMGIIVYCLGFVYKSMSAILSEIHTKNQMIQEMLETDKLTGLCNRWVAEERLKVMLACQERYGGITFVLFLDLDGFKAINDTYHHIAGDHTLKTIAKRLKSAMRPEDIVSRMGGDEFVIVAHIDDDDLEQARKYIQDIVKRLLVSISAPIIWENHSLSLGASIGIAEHAYQHPITAEELMHRADMEMFSIKRSGKMGGSMNGEKFTTI